MIKFSTKTFGKVDAPKFLPSSLIPNFASYTGRSNRTDEDIRRMAESLLANGQEVPITVRKGDKNEAIPVTGHTRILAADLINNEGLTGYRIDAVTERKVEIKYSKTDPFLLTATVRANMSEVDALFASFVENIDRTDLKPTDYVLFLKLASETTGMNDAAIADKLGKPASFISNLRKFATLDIETQREVAKGNVKFDAAHRVLTQIDKADRKAVIAKAKADNDGKATAAGIARAASALGVAIKGTLKRTDADVKALLDAKIDATENDPRYANARAFLFAMRDYRAGSIGGVEFDAAFEALAAPVLTETV